jgi:hypothetical protein
MAQQFVKVPALAVLLPLDDGRVFFRPVMARLVLSTGLGHCSRGMTDFSSHSIPSA